GARPHIVRDVGDCDVDDESAGIAAIGVGPCEYGVVMVLGVDRVDGDEGNVAPIFPSLDAGGTRPFPGLQRPPPELYLNCVSVDREQAAGTVSRKRAQSLLHPRIGQTVTTRSTDFDRDKIAIPCFACRTCCNRELASDVLLVDRNKSSAATRQSTKDAEHAML